MRLLRNTQAEMDFVRPTTLKVVKEYRRKYEGVGRILDENPKILVAFHRDLAGRLSESRTTVFTTTTGRSEWREAMSESRAMTGGLKSISSPARRTS